MRNTLKCNLTGRERITNNSYLKKRLAALGWPAASHGADYFRKHYASEKEVARLRQIIIEGGTTGQPMKGLQDAATIYKKSPAWLLKVALMNGKGKLFREQAARQGYIDQA
tara:strand:+ start:160 stop:492 length:333 start_codon:yes stop_codon:yes gene_type:complete